VALSAAVFDVGDTLVEHWAPLAGDRRDVARRALRTLFLVRTRWRC